MSVTVSFAQINSIVGSFKQNLQMIADAISHAKNDHSDVIIHPELALTGYPPEELLFRPTFIQKVEDTLEQIAKLSIGITTIIGAPVIRNNKLFNMACVLRDGKSILEYAKQHLPNYRAFDKKRYFNKGKENGIIEVNGHKVGVLICEDIWKKPPTKKAKEAGAELLLVLNASPFRAGKTQERFDLLKQPSDNNQIPIVYNNLFGGQDELIFDGESMVFNADGELTFQAPSFAAGALTQTLLEKQPQKAIKLSTQSIDHGIYQALILGVKDYANKNGFPGMMLGFSGGIDSAPLKDVFKTKIYELAKYRIELSDGTIENPHYKEIIPDRVITRPPSAELAPDQVDEDSLPPYDILDAVLRMFIEEFQSVDDIVAQGYEREIFERVANLVLLNEYKRCQSAPGIRITKRAFGKDRRYPITSHFRCNLT